MRFSMPMERRSHQAFIPARTLIEIRGVTETLNMRQMESADTFASVIWKASDFTLSSACMDHSSHSAVVVTDNKIDGVVITLVDLEGRKDSDAGKTPEREKQIFSHK